MITDVNYLCIGQRIIIPNSHIPEELYKLPCLAERISQRFTCACFRSTIGW